jgi:hypothetical protein
MAPVSAPDLIEPAVGWRTWELRRDLDGRPSLRSIGGAVWLPGEPFRARCELRGASGHAAPDPGCSCGVHAVTAPGRLRGSISADASALGVVALWGRVIEHRRGYRAELAYPERLRLVCGRCLRQRVRAVPEAVVPVEGGAFVAACARHAGSLWGAGPVSGVEQVEAELLSVYAVEVLRGEPSDAFVAGPRQRIAGLSRGRGDA